MKSLAIGLALCAATLPALAQTNVSISVGQPGFYGRIDLGDYVPRPVVYAPQPILVERGPVYYNEPIYLRVPPGHRRHWSRFCGRYDACGRPVLFVRDDWYANTYVPMYREHYHGAPRVIERRPVRVVERVEYRDVYRDGPREEHRDHGRHEGWDNGRGHGEGHGGGHGGGHGHGHGHD